MKMPRGVPASAGPWEMLPQHRREPPPTQNPSKMQQYEAGLRAHPSHDQTEDGHTPRERPGGERGAQPSQSNPLGQGSRERCPSGHPILEPARSTDPRKGKGRPRVGGTAVGRRPPRRSRLPNTPTWPGAAVSTGAPESQTGGRRSRQPRIPGEPEGCRAGPGRRESRPRTCSCAPAHQVQAPPEPPRRFWAFVASLSPCGTFRRRRIKPAAEEPAARVRRCRARRSARRGRTGGRGRRRRLRP